MKGVRIVGLVVLTALAAGGTWQLFAAGAESTSTGKLTPEQHRKLAREEIALVEEVVSARESYLQNIERLIDFYTRTGNSLKLKLAKQERETLIRVKKYSYVIVGEALGPDLRPQKIIPEAEKFYQEARRYDNLPPGTNEVTRKNKRKALDLYLQLISQHHESHRIAQAAYYSAAIYETIYEDYYTAMVYYERTYQWDPLTSHPARIQAARIAYYKLKDNKKAKELYEEAMKNSLTAVHRSEGKALVNLLKAWGY